MSEQVQLILAAGPLVVCALVLLFGARTQLTILWLIFATAIYWTVVSMVGLDGAGPLLLFPVFTWLLLGGALWRDLRDEQALADAIATGIPPASRRHQRMLKAADEQLLEDAIRLHRGPDDVSQTMWKLVGARARWQAAGVTPQNATHYLEASRAGWQPGESTTGAPVTGDNTAGAGA